MGVSEWPATPGGSLMVAAATLGFALSVYGLAAIGSLLTLAGLSRLSLTRSLFFRTLSGAGAGAASTFAVLGLGSFVSYNTAAAAGDLGVGGYFFFISFAALLSVWAYNLVRLEGVLVE